jgi:F0F1-type ATP synthase gamma subunit
MAAKKPTIEQRLEAIAETLEIVAAMQLASEKRMDAALKRMDRFEAFTFVNLVGHNKRLKKLEGKS